MSKPAHDELVDIIEQAIFETGTGLEAAMLAADRIEAAAGTPVPSVELDYARMVEAGFLDAYLNIDGVKDEAEAERLLREDIASYARLAAATSQEGEQDG